MTFFSRIGLALSSAFLVACSAVTGPKITMEELREYYGPGQELFDAAVESENTEHLKAILDFGVSERDFYGAILESSINNYTISMDYLLMVRIIWKILLVMLIIGIELKTMVLGFLQGDSN